MENYIVSARKYRPSTFESVVGQRALTTTLKSNCYPKAGSCLFVLRTTWVGKTTCARIFAKTINCMTPTADGEACNQCGVMSFQRTAILQYSRTRCCFQQLGR